MSAQRKDSRGYVLRTGECQRKDGRYSFSYTDYKGERHSVYAKTLAELRKKEQKIHRDIEDGLDPNLAERITLNALYEKFMSQKFNLKPTTFTNYKYSYDHFVKDTFGKKENRQN